MLHVATPNMVAKQVTGFFTRERWILGRTPIEMEGLLGFGPGRMANGAAVYALLFLPLNHEFVEQWNLLEPIMATLVKQLQASEPYAP